MDSLWAPWRMEYIRDKRQEGEGGVCIFCNMASQKSDRENLVLARGEHNYVVMNRYPYNCGHLLVVPYEHTPHLKELKKEAHQEMMDWIAKSMDVLEARLKAEGFNCGINVGSFAGGGILDHLHWHIVPRWKGDTNFLPVLSGTRSLPEYLAETYNKIIHDFQKGEESL